MFIETEMTPNPATLKFLPGRSVMEKGSAYFPNRDLAVRSPLALRLFNLEGVTGVFFGADFVTVTKDEPTEWTKLRALVLGTLMDHFTANLPIIISSTNNDEHEENFNEADRSIVEKICELLDTRVRPAVASDGGDIVFHSFTDGIVYLRMQGACSGCPSSAATLKMGVENMLRHYIPEVIEVRAVA